MRLNSLAMSRVRPARRRLLARLLAATLAAPTALAWAQASPATPFPAGKPVRLVVGFGPGTGPDIAARIVAQQLSELWGGAGVIVDNKAGAAGQIAASEVARAPADGYTLLFGETGNFCISPHTYRRLPFNPQKDFTPISQAVTADFVLVVSPDKVPARNVKDYVQWAKGQKGMFMGTFGAGTLGHFGVYMFGEAVGAKPEPVHYRNTGDALAGLFSGDVSGIFSTIALAAPQIRGGKLVALGTTSDKRSTSLPDVPTISEQGYPKLRFNAWFGLFGPAGLPAPLAERIAGDVRKAVTAPAGKKRLEEAGFQPTGTTPAEFARIIAEDSATWGRAVKATGFKAD